MRPDSRLLTAEDLLAPGYRRGELWDGVFVVREPSGGSSGAVGFRVAAALAHALEGEDGWAFVAEQGFLVSREPDRVLAPDVSYLSRDRLPAPPVRGFIDGAPEFAVEVRSPAASWTATIEKGGVWIGHGVRVVWCIDPLARRAVVMRPGEPPVERGPGEAIGALPVLELAVGPDDLFASLA